MKLNAKRSVLTQRLNLSFDADCVKSRAVDFAYGKLRGVRAFKEKEGPSYIPKRRDVAYIAGVSNNRVYVITQSNGVWVTSDGINYTSVKEQVDGQVYSHVHRDRIYLFPHKGLYSTLGSSLTTLESVMPVVDVTTVNERLVVLLSNGRVYYGLNGAESAKINGDDSEYFTLPSRCVALQNVGYNAAYALGETCYKLEFSADFKEIKYACIARGIGEVVRASAVKRGGGLVFATKRGLYSLKNDKISSIFAQLSGIVGDFGRCSGAIIADRYALTVPVGDDCVTYLLDLENERVDAILPRGITSVAQCRGSTSSDVYASFTDGSLRVRDEAETERFRFVREGVDFGNTLRKFLRSITITARGDASVTIESEREKRTYLVRGKQGPQKIPVSVCGRAFTVSIEGYGEAENVVLTAETYGEVRYGG